MIQIFVGAFVLWFGICIGRAWERETRRHAVSSYIAEKQREKAIGDAAARAAEFRSVR